MTTLTISQAPTKANIQNDYASGEFDAAIAYGTLCERTPTKANSRRILARISGVHSQNW
ncbi:MAG TPA: hypothetical protein V6D25_02735 [Leptolyngbyaceae cyanobacterium]